MVPLYFFGNLLFEKMESLKIHFEKIKILFSLQNLLKVLAFAVILLKKGESCNIHAWPNFQTSNGPFSELREPILTIRGAKWRQRRVLSEGFEEKTKMWFFDFVFWKNWFFMKKLLKQQNWDIWEMRTKNTENVMISHIMS